MIFLVAYLICAIIALRAVAGHIAYRIMLQKEPEVFDWVVGALVGICAGALWPIVFIAVVSSRVGVFTFGAEREAINKAREELISKQLQELERLLED